MPPAFARRIARVAGLIAVILIVACSWLPVVQEQADAAIDAGFKRSLVSFASARALNGLISVLQGTELGLHPLGVGVTLTLGQALDPVNDLVEQFATLMLVASVAFGIQKVLLLVGGHWLVSLGVSAIALAWGALYLKGAAPGWLTKALILAALIRFAIPLATLGSGWFFQHFLDADYRNSQQAIVSASAQLESAVPQETQASADKGIIDKLRERVTEPVTAVRARYEAIKSKVEQVTERIIKLMVVFVLQTLIVPVFLLWALYRGAMALARAPWQLRAG
jgi:hypothetical protein